jgi:NAD+ kinase
MRLGIIGHLGYEGVPEILHELVKLAESLDLDLQFEGGLHEAARGGTRLEAPVQIDALMTLGGDVRCFAVLVFSKVRRFRFLE